jgi:hypothetical protein
VTLRYYVWTGSVRAQGVFRSMDDAVQHCRVLTNDHRRKYELEPGVPGAWRYVGPRGRRHGSRLVAWICTPLGAESLGLNLKAIYGAAAEAS